MSNIKKNISEECTILRFAIKFHKEIEINIKAIKTSCYYVTLDHKTSHKGILFIIYYWDVIHLLKAE